MIALIQKCSQSAILTCQERPPLVNSLIEQLADAAEAYKSAEMTYQLRHRQSKKTLIELILKAQKEGQTISEISRHTGISRPRIYAMLQGKRET